MKKILIFGHKNPDTDSVCGSIAFSYLKNALGYDTEARILSPINKETEFVLNYFGFDIPSILEDVKVRIKDINYHKNFYLNENDSIYSVYYFMNNNNITGIPLVANGKKYVGYVSLKEIAHSMINNNNSNIIDTTFMNIVNTISSNNYIKIDDYIIGNIIPVSVSSNSFDSLNLNSDSIVIVGSRDEIIDYSIKSCVKLLILTSDNKLSSDQIELCNKNGVNVISTPLNSFDTIKIINLSNKISSIKRSENSICLNREDYLSDFIDISNKTKHTNYPIISVHGNCHGLLRLIDTNDYEKNKVILVDHNSFKQSVEGIEEAEILEVVDHHNISNIITNSPINFRNMSIGSVNTIIYNLFKENKIDIPYNIAGLLMSGIISDTVLLNSPTTTTYDEIALNDLSNICNINYKSYGMEELKSGMDILSKSIEDIIYNDYKVFSSEKLKFSIGQVLCVDFNDYNNIDDYVKVLDDISLKNNYVLSALFISNILTKESMVIYNNGGENIIKTAFNIKDIYEGVVLPNILSRKKQIVPNIMDVL